MVAKKKPAEQGRAKQTLHLKCIEAAEAGNPNGLPAHPVAQGPVMPASARSPHPVANGHQPRQRRPSIGKLRALRKLSLADVLAVVDQPNQVSARQWTSRCPAHADSNPSLSISEDSDGEVLLYCHADCKFDEIVQAVRRRRDGVAGSARGLVRSPGRIPLATGHERNGDAPAASRPPDPVTLVSAPNGARNWGDLASRFEAALDEGRLGELSRQLGVSVDSLRALHVGWRDLQGACCYTFPEFNAEGMVVGISRRDVSGEKRMITGSERGLYLPIGWSRRESPVLICEGASDTAALTMMEFAAVGRPAAHLGADLLISLFRQLPADRELIVVGENDGKQNGRWPGRDGAESIAKKLATGLGRRMSYVMPPKGAKDVREFFANEIRESNRRG